MSTAKELVREVLETQPDDSTYDEIMRELAFDRMVARGLEDVRAGSAIGNEEMQRRIMQWPVALGMARKGGSPRNAEEPIRASYVFTLNECVFSRPDLLPVTNASLA
jgi:hypothetical protein